MRWTKNRNRLKAARACDLAFIASNLMFLNRCEEAYKQRRIARKRKATTVSNSSSACAAVSSTDAVASAVERQEIQESEVDNEGEEAEEYDDGPWIQLDQLDFNIVEEELDNVLENFDGDSFEVYVEVQDY